MNFDLNIAKKLGCLSWISYWISSLPSYQYPPPTYKISDAKNYIDALEEFLALYNIKLYKACISNDDNYCLICYDSCKRDDKDCIIYDNVYISFCGTNNIESFMDDISFLLKDVEMGKQIMSVNAGFYDGYHSLTPMIYDALKNLPFNNLYICGHSLGGAMAHICVLDLVFNCNIDTNKINIYTFASPRIGDVRTCYFYDDLQVKSFRIFHEKDFVPHLPPTFVYYDDIKYGLLINENKCIINADISDMVVIPDLYYHRLNTYLNLIFSLRENECRVN